MQLHCPDCGARIAANDTDLRTRLARCRACDSVFSFRGALENEARGPHARPPMTPRPRRIRVQEQGDTLVVKRPWYRPWHLVAALFLVVWSLFAAGMFLSFSGSTAPIRAPFGLPEIGFSPLRGGGPLGAQPLPAAPWSGGFPRLLSLVPLAFLIIGLVGGYMALAGVVNKTVIRLGRRLSIRHGPLPWPGNRTIDAARIRQLYVVRRERYRWHRIHDHRHDLHTLREPVLVTWFALRAVLDDGTSLTLIDRIDDEEEAAWLERAIEQRLGIADQPVRSEFSPPQVRS